MNRYRVLPPLKVSLPDGRDFVQGDEFDWDPSEENEAWYLENELFEIVPRRYRVTGESVVDGAAPGEEFEAAMTQGREALLLGSHIERVDPDPEPEVEPKQARRRRTANPIKE